MYVYVYVCVYIYIYIYVRILEAQTAAVVEVGDKLTREVLAPRWYHI